MRLIPNVYSMYYKLYQINYVLQLFNEGSKYCFAYITAIVFFFLNSMKSVHTKLFELRVRFRKRFKFLVGVFAQSR